MDSERARTLHDWGCYEGRTGDPEQGQQKMDEAHAIFERLGMPHESHPVARPA
jgi:hypothetical protein